MHNPHGQASARDPVPTSVCTICASIRAICTNARECVPSIINQIFPRRQSANSRMRPPIFRRPSSSRHHKAIVLDRKPMGSKFGHEPFSPCRNNSVRNTPLQPRGLFTCVQCMQLSPTFVHFSDHIRTMYWTGPRFLVSVEHVDSRTGTVIPRVMHGSHAIEYTGSLRRPLWHHHLFRNVLRDGIDGVCEFAPPRGPRITSPLVADPVKIYRPWLRQKLQGSADVLTRRSRLLKI